MTRLIGPALILALGFAAGCNNCEKLTESICNDLGEADCATWKSLGGPDKVVPGGRGVDRACSMMRSNKDSYNGLLLGARSLVVADQLQKAVAAKDQAKIDELNAKQKELVESIKQGIAKVSGK